MSSVEVENGRIVKINGKLEPGDYYPAGSTAKIRVGENGAARLVDGDLIDGSHKIGGEYSDLGEPTPRAASSRPPAKKTAPRKAAKKAARKPPAKRAAKKTASTKAPAGKASTASTKLDK